MTKINLGVFAVAATVLAAAWAFRPLQRRGWLRVPVIVAFLRSLEVAAFNEAAELRRHAVGELQRHEMVASTKVVYELGLILGAGVS